MSYTIRRLIPDFITGLVGGLVIIELFIKVPYLSDIVKQLTTWASVMIMFALLIGVYNIFGFHFRQVRKRKPGEWFFSAYTIILLVFSICLGLTMGASSVPYMWLWFNFSAWLYMCSLAIQGYFMVSGAYRAMKVRGLETILFLIAAVIVVLAEIPLASTFWPGVIPVELWLINFPVTGANTGIAIGVGIGIVALGARMLYGKEKTLKLEAEGG